MECYCILDNILNYSPHTSRYYLQWQSACWLRTKLQLRSIDIGYHGYRVILAVKWILFNNIHCWKAYQIYLFNNLVIKVESYSKNIFVLLYFLMNVFIIAMTSLCCVLRLARISVKAVRACPSVAQATLQWRATILAEPSNSLHVVCYVSALYCHPYYPLLLGSCYLL